MPSIAELLLAQGRQRADARRQEGAISAGMWTNLADIAARTGGQIADELRLAPARKQEAEIRGLQLDDLKAQQAGRETAATESAALRDLFSRETAPTQEEIYSVVGPERGVKIVEGLAALQDVELTRFKSQQEVVAATLAGMDALPEDARAEFYPAVRQNLVARGIITEKDAPAAYDGQWWQQARNYGQAPQKPAEGFTLSPGQQRFGADGKPIASVPKPVDTPPPPTVGSFEDYVTQKFGPRPTAEQITEARRTYGDAGRAPNVSVNVSGTGSDAEAIADAIINGDQPPTLTGLYRNAAPVRAILARKGYDYAKASLDWRATERYLSTLNGPGQVRLRQATEFVSHTLPLVQELSETLTAKIPRSQFPILNSAALAAAKSGTLGQDAQVIATQFESQIADLQSELSVMYRGGNSPTDESMKKASEMLRSNWTAPQLKGALDLISRNVQIRLNSLRAAGVGGGGDNRYAPEHPPAPSDSGRGGGAGVPSYQDYLKSKKKPGGGE